MSYCDDDAALRRLAGLAGAQDDADGLVLELVADVFDEIEAGGVGLHDDVEQHGGDVGMRAHQLAALGRRIGRQDFERLAVETVVAQRKARAFMHGLIVVDDGDLPFARRRWSSGAVPVSSIRWRTSSCSAIAKSRRLPVSVVAAPPLAVRGMIMRNVVPCPSLELQHHPAAELLGDEIIDDMQAQGRCRPRCGAW